MNNLCLFYHGHGLYEEIRAGLFGAENARKSVIWYLAEDARERV